MANPKFRPLWAVIAIAVIAAIGWFVVTSPGVANAGGANSNAPANLSAFQDKLAQGLDTKLAEDWYGHYGRSLLPDALAKQSDLNQAAAAILGHDISDAVAYGSTETGEAKDRDSLYRHILLSPKETDEAARLLTLPTLPDGTHLQDFSEVLKTYPSKWDAALAVPVDQHPTGLESFIVEDASSPTGYRVSDQQFFDAAGVCNILDSFTWIEDGSGWVDLVNFYQPPTDYVSQRRTAEAPYHEDQGQRWHVFGLFDKNGNNLLSLDPATLAHLGVPAEVSGPQPVYLGVNEADGRLAWLVRQDQPQPTPTPTPAPAGGQDTPTPGGGNPPTSNPPGTTVVDKDPNRDPANNGNDAGLGGQPVDGDTDPYESVDPSTVPTQGHQNQSDVVYDYGEPSRPVDNTNAQVVTHEPADQNQQTTWTDNVTGESSTTTGHQTTQPNHADSSQGNPAEDAGTMAPPV